jgi:D-arabinose 1-dehydrogenase-like Zn-dependent alcohol dehydrogenase
MRAMVLHGFGETLRHHADWPEPEPGPNDVKVRVRAVGAGLTIVIMTSTPGLVTSYPRIPGHEIAGEVVAIGSEVRSVKPGQRVTAHFFLTCGHCRYCRSGRESLCENFGGFLGMARDGGYAEFMCLPERNVVPIPDGVSDVDAAVAADAIATAYHSCTKHAKIQPGEDVVVIGAAGGVGIHVVQMAKICGGRVIAVDIGDDKLEFCRTWGADVVLDARSGFLPDIVRKATDGRGADAIVDVVATPRTLEESIAALAIGGRLAVVGFRPKGAFGEDWSFKVDGLLLNRGQLEIHGSRYVSHAEIRETLKLVQLGRMKPVVSKTYSLDEAEDAHSALREGRTLGRLAITI